MDNLKDPDSGTMTSYLWARIIREGKFTSTKAAVHGDPVTRQTIRWTSTPDLSIQFYEALIYTVNTDKNIADIDAVLHNIYGPAVYYDGKYEYWVNGEKITESEFNFFYGHEAMIIFLKEHAKKNSTH